MTGTRVDTFERWMRDVEKRLGRLERRPVEHRVALRGDEDALIAVIAGLVQRVAALESDRGDG